MRGTAGITGATVAAFAASSPELSVAVSAAGAGTPQIALGDALGSNVANFGLAFGLVLVTLSLPGRRSRIGRGRGASFACLYAANVVALLSMPPPA